MIETEDLDKQRGYIKDLQNKSKDYCTKGDYNKLEMNVKNITIDMQEAKDEINQLRKDVDKIKDHIAKQKVPTLDQFNELKGNHEHLEDVVASLQKTLGLLNDKVKNMKSGGGGGGAIGGADQEELDKCKEDLENLRKAFEKHRDQAIRNLEQLNNEMPQKADKKDLMDLEDRLMNKLHELI